MPEETEQVASSAADTSKQTDANSTVDSSTTEQGANGTAQGAASEKPESLMDAVDAALKADAGDGASPNPEGETGTTEGEQADAKKDGEKATPDEQQQQAKPEDEKLPFHNHPRWKEMVTKNRDLSTEVEKLRPDAEVGRQIQDYMVRSQLTPDETASGLEIMRLMKADPLEALAKLKPYYETLMKVNGEILPEDVQKQVEQGYLDAESAKKLVRTQSQLGLREAQIEQDRVRQQQAAAEQFKASLTGAVGAWETNIASRDPEYPKLKDFVFDRVKVLSSANPPKSAEEATKLVQQAYDEVKAKITPFVPKPTPKQIIPLNSSRSSVNAQTKPKSIHDAVDRALAAAR